MRTHTYIPPQIDVAIDPESGNRILVGRWPDGEEVLFVLSPDAALRVAGGLTAQGLIVERNLPPHGPGVN